MIQPVKSMAAHARTRGARSLVRSFVRSLAYAAVSWARFFSKPEDHVVQRARRAQESWSGLAGWQAVPQLWTNVCKQRWIVLNGRAHPLH